MKVPVGECEAVERSIRQKMKKKKKNGRISKEKWGAWPIKEIKRWVKLSGGEWCGRWGTCGPKNIQPKPFLFFFLFFFLWLRHYKMDSKDMTKTTFTMKWGIYCYTVMPVKEWLQLCYMTWCTMRLRCMSMTWSCNPMIEKDTLLT